MNQNTSSVFGYVRVSTENQLENYSIEEQTVRIRSYCQAKGWHLLKIYTDGAIPAAIPTALPCSKCFLISNRERQTPLSSISWTG